MEQKSRDPKGAVRQYGRLS